jgi:transcription elongation factor Elf1
MSGILRDDVPPTLTCRFCGRAGFVRFETVIAKGQAYRHFYCGACDRTWQIDDADPVAPPDPPDGPRKRPLRRSKNE